MGLAMRPSNDNRPHRPDPPADFVPIVGVVHGDGQVLITDARWRPAPIATAAALADLFPNDPREA